MKQTGLDLTIHENAEQSKNKTALTGVFIMNVILALAYLLKSNLGMPEPRRKSLTLFYRTPTLIFGSTFALLKTLTQTHRQKHKRKGKMR